MRGHGQTENSLHWVLGVVYWEDACRVHDLNAAESLAIVRRVALNLAKLETTQKRSMKSKLQRALLSDDYRELLIFADVKSVYQSMLRPCYFNAHAMLLLLNDLI